MGPNTLILDVNLFEESTKDTYNFELVLTYRLCHQQSMYVDNVYYVSFKTYESYFFFPFYRFSKKNITDVQLFIPLYVVFLQ